MWRRIFKRKRWFLNIPTIVWQIIWEFTKDTIIEETRDYFTKEGIFTGFLDYLLQHPVIIIGIVAIVVFIWAYVDTRKEKQNDLKIEVDSAISPDGIPVDNVIPTCTIDVSVKFKPIGEIKMEGLKLHIGGNEYEPISLPVMMIDREDTYSVLFRIPNELMIRKGIKAYIRVIGGNRDWRSNNFRLAFGAYRKFTD